MGVHLPARNLLVGTPAGEIWTAVRLLLDSDSPNPIMGQGASQTPEAFLEKALRASDAVLRAKYATRGLSHPGLERDTQVLLLRQLYLAHLQREQFTEARAVAEQMTSLGALEEPAFHDAARACIGQGDLDAAARHFRMAARRAPAHRRALHFWSLGRVVYLQGAYDVALTAFVRAVRWGTDNLPLYRAHEVLTRHHLGEKVDLRRAYEGLGAQEPLPLYAEFLGGQLLRELGEPKLARSLLRQFLRQAGAAATEIGVGLRAEMRRAEEWLAELESLD